MVDTKGRGVEAITPKGVVTNGKEYELDCLVYATGFELATDWSHSSGMEIYGRNGLTVTEMAGWRFNISGLGQPWLSKLSLPWHDAGCSVAELHVRDK